MAITQGRSMKKPSSGRRLAYRKKKLYEKGNIPMLTKLGNISRKIFRTKGGSTKVRHLSSNIANVTDPATKKTTQAKIKAVVENAANRNFARRSIITKGTILDTEKGKARVTSRPGQEGTINAVLIK